MRKACLFIFLCIASISFGQSKMKIIFNDGHVKTGMYDIYTMSFGFPSKTRVVSKNPKEKYFLDSIKEITMYLEDQDSVVYKVINTKKYIKTKKIKKQLGIPIFEGEKINLYSVSVFIYQGGTTGLFTTLSRDYEYFAKRKKDSIAYNIGYIYGAGQMGIKDRVKKYFTDCPNLVEKVENDEISKEATNEIVLYYENNCN